MLQRVKSQSSLESIGLGSPTCPSPNLDVANLPKPVEFSISKLDPEGASPTGEYLYSSIALLIYCEKHNKVALSYHEGSEAAWLPFIAAPINKKWVDSTQDFVKSIFSKEESEGTDVRLTNEQIEINIMHTVHILRVQVPVTQKFIYRLTQFIKVTDINEKNCVCSQSSNRLKWVHLAEAKSGNVNNLWGPEVALFSQWIPNLKQQEIYEFGLEQAYINVSSNGVCQNAEEEMLLSIGIGQDEVEKVYQDFLEFCFPAFYMTFTAFHKYIAQYVLPLKEDEKTSLRLFSGFNFAYNGYLSFHEFLLGLVVMEPNCLHNELRLKYIFRYHDEDQDQELNEMEVAKLAQNLQLKDTSVFREQMDSKNLQYSTFLKLAQDGQIPNIESTCRLSPAIIPRICKNVDDRQERRLAASKRTEPTLQTNSNLNLCLACRSKKYSFGTHCVRLDPSGRCVEPHRFSDCKYSACTIFFHSNQLFYSDDTVGKADNLQEISMAMYSQDYVFNTVSIGHTFLDMIREFNVSKGTINKPNGFLAAPKYKQTFLQYLKILCQNVISLFECEGRLIKINSPVYVIGDICGNLKGTSANLRVF